MADVLRTYKGDLVGKLCGNMQLLSLLAVHFQAKGIITQLTLNTVEQKGGVSGATFLLNLVCDKIESKPNLLKIVFQILKKPEFEDLSSIFEKMQAECSPTPDLADITPLGKDFNVFISYRWKDEQKTFTDNLCINLARIPHVKVWKDDRVLEPGAKLTPEILIAIASSDLFLCVLSTDYFESEYCKMELQHALQHGKKLFPIEWVGRFSLPREFESSLKGMLRHKYDPEAINEKAEERKCMNKVIAVIEHQAPPVQEPPSEKPMNSKDEGEKKSGRNLLKKSPEVHDVFCLMMPVSASWEQLGAALEVSVNTRKDIKKDSQLNADDRLETVLNVWNSSQPSVVTWESIIKVLVECGKNNVAGDVRKYLEKPEVYEKYINKKDFRFY